MVVILTNIGALSPSWQKASPATFLTTGKGKGSEAGFQFGDPNSDWGAMMTTGNKHKYSSCLVFRYRVKRSSLPTLSTYTLCHASRCGINSMGFPSSHDESVYYFNVNGTNLGSITFPNDRRNPKVKTIQTKSFPKRRGSFVELGQFLPFPISETILFKF